MTNEIQQEITTDVCIAGGGPAGMVLAVLLARAGHDVLVLESHKDFKREFRGEVLMPLFTKVMSQVGLLDDVLKCHHEKFDEVKAYNKDKVLLNASIGPISPDFPYALWMPQPELLQALYNKGTEYKGFHMLFGARAKEILRNKNQVVGLIAEQDQKNIKINAKVTVGSDGRWSQIRKLGKFELEFQTHDFDILWFNVPQGKERLHAVRAHLSANRNMLSLPKYPDLLQYGLLVRPNGLHDYQVQGLEKLKQDIIAIDPSTKPHVEKFQSFADFHPLQAVMSFVKNWAQDGILLIGDAAHTCSPAGAIGVSVATCTAIVAADVIDEALEKNDFSQNILNQVQIRREKDVRRIQGLQKRASFVLGVRGWFVRKIAFFLLPLVNRFGLLGRFFGPLATLREPLQIRKKV